MPVAGHDRWDTSVVQLKWDLNQRPFDPGTKSPRWLATISQSPPRANAVEGEEPEQRTRAQACCRQAESAA